MQDYNRAMGGVGDRSAFKHSGMEQKPLGAFMARLTPSIPSPFLELEPKARNTGTGAHGVRVVQ